MKKLFFAAVAVLSFAGANAQEVKYGAKAGLNLATISNLDNSKNLVSFNS